MATWALCISSANWAHARDVPTSHAGIAWSLPGRRGLLCVSAGLPGATYESLG